METPEFVPPEPPLEPPEFDDVQPPPRPIGPPPGLGDRLTWVSGLVLALSAFMGWYTGSGEGLRIAVLGWDTGALGKLVFFVGLLLIAIVLLRELGIELPATVPESLLVIALGALATIFVLIRVITIPEDLLPANGRGAGLWIALVAAVVAVGAGVVRAGEER